MSDRRLRGVLAEIAEVIGEPLAWVLADRFGGREIWVPSADGIEPGHSIAMAIGIDAARAFCRHFEGPRFLVPLGRGSGRVCATLAAERRATAQRLLAEGRSAREVAEAAGVHLRTVFRYRRRAG